jgi:hypothetical protein
MSILKSMVMRITVFTCWECMVKYFLNILSTYIGKIYHQKKYCILLPFFCMIFEKHLNVFTFSSKKVKLLDKMSQINGMNQITI